MTTESDMRINYTEVLKQLQQELDGIDERRQALQATIAGMKRLVNDEPMLPGISMPGGAKPVPVIPPGFFKGKTPTEAYRDLVRVWPGTYTPPQIVDALLAGGLVPKTRTDLLQAIHSVLKRERAKAHDASDESWR